MTQVILQPAGGSDAQRHYQATVGQPVPLARITPFLTPEDQSSLIKLFPDGRVRIWGVVPGGKNANRTRWERVNDGDVIFFCGQGNINSTAVVVHKTQNAPLAENLWGKDADGATWEYLY